MNRKKVLWWILVILGVLGGILFFPWPVGNSFTCLFHRFAMPAQSVGTHHPGHQLVDFYIQRFSFVWWGSLLLIVSGIYLLTKKQKGLS